MEAAALGHAINLVDVYSNSWSPPDSGFYFMEPGPLTKRAIKRGIVEVSIDKSFDVLLLSSLLVAAFANEIGCQITGVLRQDI